jgi:hypothetical protein
MLYAFFATQIREDRQNLPSDGPVSIRFTPTGPLLPGEYFRWRTGVNHKYRDYSMRSARGQRERWLTEQLRHVRALLVEQFQQ